jgi:hypothetical protein
MNISSSKSLFSKGLAKIKSIFHVAKQSVQVNTTQAIKANPFVPNHTNTKVWLTAKCWRSCRPSWFKKMGFNSKIDAIKVHGSLTPIQPFGNFRSIKPLYGSNAWLRQRGLGKLKLVA